MDRVPLLMVASTLLLALGTALPPAGLAAGLTVTTLAGSVPGFANGAPTAAKFASPKGVAVDRAGNVYVADTDNHCIRKVAVNGQVTTLAGSRKAGFKDGRATAAQFNEPQGIAVDAAGNVYVADTVNNAIRKITPRGVVTTLAGGKTAVGAKGAVDGQGKAARFAWPVGLALDSRGTLFVSENVGARIRTVSPAGVVRTVAAAPELYGLGGLAVDGGGNVYVANRDSHVIQRVTPQGAVTTLAGHLDRNCEPNSGAPDVFCEPTGVAVDRQGFVYVADTSSHKVRRIAPNRAVTVLGQDGTWLPQEGAGIGVAARFGFPAGIAADPRGRLLLADTYHHVIRVIR